MRAVPLTTVCTTRCTPTVLVPSMLGTSMTSTVPRTAGPAKETLLQSAPGSTTGTAWLVCSAMTM